jgi:hypothetical protein
MSERLTAVGTLGGIMEKTGGWHEIHVNLPGKQYPLKVSTKKQELVELARAAGENVMEWTYTEQDSGRENPNRPGTNYVNRYFEGVAPVSENAPNANPTPRPTQSGAGEGMSKEEWARKDSAIHKMACIKAAADALKHTVPSDPTPEDLNKFGERVFILAYRWHQNVLAERDDPTGEGVPF